MFFKPPLHEPLSLPELYDWHYIHNRDFPLFVFENGRGSVRTINMGEGVQGIHRATQYIRERIGSDPPTDVKREPPIIAILAASDSITYFCCILGAHRTGRCVFPISPRNSASAIAFLLSETRATTLLASADAYVQDLAVNALELLGNREDVQKICMPAFENLFSEKGFDPTFQLVESASLDLDAITSIYHSSGTTSHPKPIYWTHRIVYWIATLPCYGETDIVGCVFGYHSIPLFHGMGLAVLAWPATVGTSAAVFKPKFPAISANPVNTFEALLATKADYAFVSPVLLEEWAKYTSYIDKMCKMKGIIYGGGPLDKDAGDLLSSKGVNVYLAYGTTQTAIISEFLPKPPGTDWDYFKMSPNRLAFFEERADNEFEIIMPATQTFWPCIINTTVNGIAAFATSDLVSPHPTRPGYYRLIGRVDDQIMHSTGEKTNPGPLESILNQHPNVEASVFFGRGRPQCGILIQPKKDYILDVSDTTKLNEFKDSIWPAIKRLNDFAPKHSRIFKEMILVTSLPKSFEYTPKGNLRRQHMIDQYAHEINALYEAVDGSSQDGISEPYDWSQPSVKDFIRALVNEAIGPTNSTMSDDADLFEYGLDSLQATRIRNTIARILRKSRPKATHKLATSLIYDFPTVSKLAEYVFDCVADNGSPTTRSDSSKKSELHVLVKKYTVNFPKFDNNGRTSAGGGTNDAVVLLTGATGSLGSNILAKLVSSSRVARVFALSFPSLDGSIKERLSMSLKLEGLEKEMKDDTKLRLVAGDASKPYLGLEKDCYSELQSSVTHIIHSGWRVNFNNTISSFEKNIRSVRNLIDFSLGGSGVVAARIFFISSVGVFGNSAGNGLAPEEYVLSSNTCLGSGYTESKWVAEEILRLACQETSLESTIIRPTQLTGGANGAWKTSDWFPSLIKSSIALGKLPNVKGAVSWIASDVAAMTIVEALHTDEPVLHIAHPRPVTWSSLMSELSNVLELPIVAYDEWVGALENSNGVVEEDPTSLRVSLCLNPALRLLTFFRAAKDHAGGDIESFGVSRLVIKKALKVSAALRNAEQLRAKNVALWIDYWKRSGFFEG